MITPVPGPRFPATDGALARAKCWVDAEGVHIDVRKLPPPEPLVAILELIASIREPTTVIVHHERDPKLLYPELAEIGWGAERIDAAPGEVRLKLERTA